MAGHAQVRAATAAPALARGRGGLPESVHNSWPLSQCRRIESRFSNKALAGKAVRKFRSDYLTSFGFPMASPNSDDLTAICPIWNYCTVLYVHVAPEFKVQLYLSF